MNTCKTCRWFENGHIVTSKWGRCEKLRKEMDDKIRSDDGFYLDLEIHESFGCIGWEEKE